MIRHERVRWKNNRAEKSRRPTRRRERKMQGFKSVGLSAKISLLFAHAAVFNIFNVQRHLDFRFNCIALSAPRR